MVLVKCEFMLNGTAIILELVFDWRFCVFFVFS